MVLPALVHASIVFNVLLSVNRCLKKSTSVFCLPSTGIYWVVHNAYYMNHLEISGLLLERDVYMLSSELSVARRSAGSQPPSLSLPLSASQSQPPTLSLPVSASHSQPPSLSLPVSASHSQPPSLSLPLSASQSQPPGLSLRVSASESDCAVLITVAA